MPTLIQTPKSKTAATDALVGLWAVALTAFLIATLYFTRPILIPLAVAALSWSRGSMARKPVFRPLR